VRIEALYYNGLNFPRVVRHMKNTEVTMSRKAGKDKKKQPRRTRVAAQGVLVGPRGEVRPGATLLTHQVACARWTSGNYDEAEFFFRKVLETEPDDPHFARYWLASCLFELGKFGELKKLLRERDDHSGVWRFVQALDAFRHRGDSDEAQRLLVEADRLEPDFKRYLLQEELVDARREVRLDAGVAERAFGCARLLLPAWRSVPGAAVWARRVLRVPPASPQGNDLPRRFPQNELRSLPSRRETWQVGLRRCQDGAPGDDGAMWLFGVANIERQEMRAMTVIDRPLTDVVAWNELVPAFIRPLDGKPARPAELVVGQRDLCDAWKPWLAKIGVGCRCEDDRQPVGQMLEAMHRLLKEEDKPPAEDIDIRVFPQTDAVWQADFVRSPTWVMNEREGAYRPWSVLVLEKSPCCALLTTHTPGDPTPDMLLEFLVRAMAGTRGRSAQRPQLIELSDSDCYDHLRPRLEAAGIACRLADEMPEFNDFCLGLARSIDGSEKCALADGKGVTRPQMESFYEAAQYYFHEAPWRYVRGEVPIEIRYDEPAMGPRYAVVLGRTGVQLGLCVYDDLEITKAMLCGYADPDENRALAVCYDEAQIMAAVDLQLIERLGWPVAAPEAWPAVMRLMPGRTPRSATADELVFLDGCLRAIPDFVKAKRTSQTYHFDVTGRRIELRLAYL
jgi:hypothetical protein